MNCLKCGAKLDIYFVNGGISSFCSQCSLNYLSVAHLMKRSDRELVREFWEYVMCFEWKTSQPCPNCQRPLSVIPLIHKGRKDPVLGCKACYHLVLLEETMAHFESQKPEAKKKLLLERMKRSREPDSVQNLMNRLAEATDSRIVVRVSSENGREFAFAVTLSGILLSAAGFLFLKQTGNTIHWGILAVICAFLVGFRYSRLRRGDDPDPVARARPIRETKLPVVQGEAQYPKSA